MSRTRHRVTRTWLLLYTLLILSLVTAACGGGGGNGGTGQGTTGGDPAAQTTATDGGDTAGQTQGEEDTQAGMAAPTTTVVVKGPTAVTQKPTGVARIQCQEGQKELVWMVRNSPVENAWEQKIVRPAFQKAQPDICLNILSINQPDIAVKRQAMLAARQPLHVWSPNWGGNGFASDRADGLLEDLTPLIQQDNFDTSVFIPEVLKIYQVEGKTYGLPFLTTGSYVYYNKELFKKAGIPDLPTDWDDKSWTWDKYVQIGKKLTQNYGNPNKAVYGAGTAVLNLEGPPMLWGHFVWPEGAYETGYAESVNVTNEASVKAYQAFHDLVYKHKVAPDPATASALDQLGGAFASGRMAMTMSGGWGHWVWRELIDDPNGFCWGAAPMPMGSPDAKIRTVIYTDPWAITSGMDQDQQDLAWTFVKFLVSPEQAAQYTKTTGTPPAQKALLEDYYQQFSKCMKPEDMQKVFEGAFSHGRESSNHMMVKWDELDQVWANNFSTFWTNKNAKASDVLAKIETQTNTALQTISAEREE